MSDLVVVVPSRGRPRRAVELARTFVSLCTADTRLLFAVDSDDPTLNGYAALMQNGPVDVRICGPWQPMVPKLNSVALSFAGASDPPFALAFMGDDHRPRSPGWDSTTLATLREMGTGVVYGNDLLQRERLCTSWVMTSNIVAALGRMVPAPVEHMYCDNSVMELARAAHCLCYLPDVVIEHMHPLAGKTEWDPGYARVNHPEQFRLDGSVFAGWQAGQMTRDVETVSALLRGGDRASNVRNRRGAG